MNSDRIFSVVVPLVQPLVSGRLGESRRRYFEAVPVAPGRVVFIGDSITASGLWEDLLPELPTSNRGIGGEMTSDVARRLDTAINDPAAVSLMVGTNDLHGPRDQRDVPGVAERAEDIIRRIRELAPSALLLVNSVLPRTELFAPRIRDLNDRYRTAASRHGAEYVDLWPTFADASGAIKQDYARDGLHLTPAGYLAWAAVLRPYLAPFAVEGRS